MDNLIGKRLDGRYSIESLVGVGGMANVYRGTDLKTGNQIAVKVLKDEFLDNEDLVRRFKNESKAISILSHPNIVKVYDVSVTDKLQYIRERQGCVRGGHDALRGGFLVQEARQDPVGCNAGYV